MVTPTSLNAADYGLVANSADQTAHLQAAIDAAQTQGLPLFIPKGIFAITQVNITAPITIYSTPGGAEFSGYGRAPTINIAPATAGNRFGPVVIENLRVNGYGATYPAGGDSAVIQASEINGLLIRDCTLTNAGGHGIYCHASNGNIQHNGISGMSQFGILCRNSDGPFSIDQNSVTYCGNNGIYIIRTSNGSDQSIVSNNQIGFITANSGGTGPYGNAVVVANANYVKIVDNMIYTTAFSGVRASNSNNLIIRGNHTFNTNEVAIYLEAPGSGGNWYGGIISDNRINGCGSGINAANSNFGAHWVEIIGNQISNCSNNTITYSGGTYRTWGRGIYCEADGLIANNQIDTTAEWGIYIGPQNNGTIGTQKVIGQVENNMLKNCAGGIAFNKEDATYGRLMIGGNTVCNYTTTAKFAAIVPGYYVGSNGEVTKVSGATDLGNATSSGFSNVILTRNFSFN